MAKASDLKFTVSPTVAALLGVYTVLTLALFQSSIRFMIRDWHREDYNYCYLIPFVALYLVWEKRQALSQTVSVSSWWGLVPFLGGVVLYWLGELGGEYYVMYVASWLVLVGLCWLHLGWPKLKLIAPALVILITMFPFPHFLHSNLSLKLQLISSQLGVALIRLFGLSAYRDGNVIDLGFTQLQIVEACSGLRYLIPLMVIGLILVYFFKAPVWKRAVLFVSTIPWAIVVNACRIALTAILASVWGVGVIEGLSHDFAGWAVFMVSLGILLGEMWLLGRIGTHQSLDSQLDSSRSKRSPSASESKAPGAGSPGRFGESMLWLPKALVAVLVLSTSLALAHSVEFREKIPAKKELRYFPLQIGEWRGQTLLMGDDIIKSLDLSEYVMIDYQAAGGKKLDFYVAYYESQRKGESTHTPATCLPGSGWVFEDSGLVTFATPGYQTGSLTASRAFMTKANHRQLVYYWFPQRGRILHNLYELKLYAFWDALTQQRTDGALVRLITPLAELESTEAADERLQQFTRQILPLLAEYLPGKHID